MSGAPQQQRGRRPKKKSQYGQQLEEKQNIKEMYGIRDEQLRRYYAHAKAVKDQTGPAMISLLERRLDNAVYRAGMADTRKQARQMTTHALFMVNGRSVDVPSYRLRVGDVVMVKESKRKKMLFENVDKKLQNAQLPSWIEADAKGYGFSITALPTAEEANVGVQVQSIVELLAR